MSFFKKKFKLLMSKEYERAQVGKIIYELDKENSTASIVGQDDATEEYVPRSIIIEGKEYEITRISPYAFEKSRLTKIKFSPDSKIQSIGEKAFFDCVQYPIFSPDSQITFLYKAFSFSEARKLIIPPNIRMISSFYLANCYCINSIEFMADDLTFDNSKIDLNIFLLAQLLAI